MALLAGCTHGRRPGAVADGVVRTRRPAPTVRTVVAVAYPRFDDSDPHDWTSDARHGSYAVHGTDVSKYQTSVDWHDAKAAGISFAFIKATEGGDRVDDNFAEHWRSAKAAGVPRGAYHFYYFCRTGRRSRRAGSSATCRATARRCRRCSTWSGTRSRRPAS